jgi:hypothetical protein
MTNPDRRTIDAADQPLTDEMVRTLRSFGLHDFEFAGLTQGQYHRLRAEFPADPMAATTIHEIPTGPTAVTGAGSADPTDVPPREATAQQISTADNTASEKRPARQKQGAVEINRQGTDVMNEAKLQAVRIAPPPPAGDCILEDHEGWVWLYCSDGTCPGGMRKNGIDHFEYCDAGGIRLGVFACGIASVAHVLDHHRANGGVPTITAPQDRDYAPEFRTLVKRCGLQFELPGAGAHDDVPDAIFDRFWNGSGDPAETTTASTGDTIERSTTRTPFFDLVDIDGEPVFAETIIAEWEGQPRCLPAAIVYAKHWRVFPGRIDPITERKYSYTAARHSADGFRWGATRDLELIQRNFTAWPDALVGIPTGSDNKIVVIETDTKAGHPNLKEDGEAVLQRLIAQHGPLPDTLQGVSPTGSKHRYFEWPEGLMVRNDNSTKLGPGIDVKGEGGMVIAPPSVRNGVGTYRWINNIAPARLPEWLLKLITDDASSSAKTKDDRQEHKPNGDKPGMAEAFRAFFDPNERFGASIAVRHAGLQPFEPIKAGCAWLRNIHETGGKEYNEPQWKQSVYIATFLENGHDLAHEFSNKYPRYIEAQTEELWERKLDERKHNPKLGWTSFKDLGSATCETCPHFPKKLSPLHLGLSLRQGPTVPEHKLFQSSAEFVANFVPPDYLIDGMLQRRCVYSLTAKTGDGKTTIALLLAASVARGTPLAGCEVEKGRVLIFVGENPDDVRTRWMMLCEKLGHDPDQLDVVFMPFTLDLSAEDIRAKIDAEADKAGPFSLLIVDTSAAYYSGDDENDNVQLGKHANMLRSFVNLPGGPTILVTCHPTKNPDMENLLPRGGGAFLAAVDGNLVAIKDANTMLTEVTTHGKFRGPDFAPLTFKLIRDQSPNIVDSKGRRMWSVYAQAISAVEHERLEGIGYMEQEQVLRVIAKHPGCSLTDIARHLSWLTGKGLPNKQKVHRLMPRLLRTKLVKQRHDGRYIPTKPGQEATKQTTNGLKNG